MSKNGFGVAKPLPGQPGYKVSVSDTLEKEAKEMEERLKMLQERIQQQAQEESEVKSSSGTRWKSARDKGSIRSYAKDVQEKHKKKLASATTTAKVDPNTRATAAARRSARENNTSGGYANKTIEHWTVSDVGDWLQSMMLTQYVDVFTANQISGPVLLDISLEDLDYMEVKALGHRKVILKGIEDLRQNKVVTKQLFASSESTNTDNNSRSRSSEGKKSNISTTNSNNNTNSSSNISNTSNNVSNKVHWSVLEPISSNQVHGGKLSVNDADDEDEHYGGNNNGGGGGGGNQTDFYDEEAERRAFQEAVMEWRRSGKTTEKGMKTITVSSGNNQEKNNQQDDGMWVNPFSIRPQSSRSSGIGFGDNDNNNNNQYDNNEGYTVLSARSEVSSSRGDRRRNLAEGTLDEEKEQAEFKAAVEAWRTGKPKPTSSITSTAKKLAEEMDREHQHTAERLSEYQQEMRNKIEEATRQLEEAKVRLQQTSSKKPINDDDDDDNDNIDDYNKNQSNFEEKNGDNDWDGHLSPYSSRENSDDENDPHIQSHVEVSLLDSHLNTGSLNLTQTVVEYNVSEPSSDDENENERNYESKYNSIDVIEITS